MRQLLPEPGPVNPDELLDLYAWPDTPWLRACMVYSLDGAAIGPDGLSGSLSSTADQQVFSACRALADAVLVGARTVRREEYKPMRAKPALRERRLAAGQAEAARLVVVSGRASFDWGRLTFQESDLPPLLLTTELAEAGDVADARAAGCEVEVVGESAVDPARVLELLHSAGLTRITLEGGPTLLGEVVRAGLLDEADFTVAPFLVGAGSPDQGHTQGAVRSGMRLAHLLTEQDYLFSRFVRTDGTGPR